MRRGKDNRRVPKRSKRPEANQKRKFSSQAARALTVRGSSFALEVIVQIGYWRFWNRWTVAQIHQVLTQERHLPISEREVLYLIGIFLVLLRCTYHLRLEEQAAYFRRHGVFLYCARSQIALLYGTLQARLARQNELGHAQSVTYGNRRT